MFAPFQLFTGCPHIWTAYGAWQTFGARNDIPLSKLLRSKLYDIVGSVVRLLDFLMCWLEPATWNNSCTLAPTHTISFQAKKQLKHVQKKKIWRALGMLAGHEIQAVQDGRILMHWTASLFSNATTTSLLGNSIYGFAGRSILINLTIIHSSIQIDIKSISLWTGNVFDIPGSVPSGD